MRPRSLLTALLALGLPGLMLAPVWHLGAVCAGEDDVLYYYPSRVWFGELITTGQPPYLNPWNGLDRPLLADPQTAVFYPATWLFAALPAQIAYPAALWLHYSLAFFGMYRLLRAKKLALAPAIFGAIAFAFCGFLLAHRAHFTIQHAAAWLPLVLWRVERWTDRGSGPRLATAALLAAGQCFSGHFQIAALTALGTLVYLLARLDGLNWRTLRAWATVWLAAGGLFAVQLLPTLAYVSVCNRGDRGILQFLENSWNPISAIGLLMPMFFGQRTPNFFDAEYWGPSHQVEQFVYPSILVLFLALAAFRADWQAHPLRRPFGWLAIFALVLALGQFTPAGPLFYLLPGASLFRVPARAMLLANLSLAVMSASVLHDLAGSLSPMHSRLRAALLSATRRPVALPLTVATVSVVLGFLVCWLLPEPLHHAALSSVRPWGAIVVVPIVIMIAGLLLLRRIAVDWQRPPPVVPAIAVLLLDLAIIGWTIDVPRGDDPRAGPVTALDERWVQDVRLSGSRLWVLTGRYDGTPGEYVDSRAKLAANTNLLAKVPNLTDYGPLMPRVYAANFPFKPWGEAESPDADRLLADTAWMRDFDVGWVLLCEARWPAPAGGELHTTTHDGFRLFRMPPTRGRAYLRDDDPGARVTIVDSRASRTEIRIDRTRPMSRTAEAAAAANHLIVPRLALPGWYATVNGRPVAVDSWRGLVSVPLADEAAAEVELRYAPPALAAGAWVTALAALALAGAALFGPHSHRPNGSNALSPR